MLRSTFVRKKGLFILSSFTIISLFGAFIVINLNVVVIDVGTIVWMDLEGGFYGIVTDSGMRYEPIDLDSRFQVHGQRLFFIALISANQASFHMWGTLIDLLYIQNLLTYR
jgi:inhibitor of cysteine peptidase